MLIKIWPMGLQAGQQFVKWLVSQPNDLRWANGLQAGLMVYSQAE